MQVTARSIRCARSLVAAGWAGSAQRRKGLGQMQGHLRLAQRFAQVKHLIDAVQGVADLPLAVGCKNPSVLAGNEAEVSLGRRAVKVRPQGVPSCIGEIPVRLVAIHDGHLVPPGR